MFRPAVLILVLSAVGAASVAHAADWLTFRGPNANGVSSESGLPSEWDAETNVKWQAEVPGSGWSAPVISGGKVVVSTAVPGADDDSPYRFEVHCFDLSTGEPLWKKVAKQETPRIPTHRDNTYASETPVTDGQHIVVYFGMTGLFCYDFDGELKWQKDLGVYPMLHGWGTASSPALHDGVVYVQVDTEGDSFLAAYDLATGDERWRVERDEASNWSSPVIWKNKTRTELVVGGIVVRSYDPTSGKQLWELNTGGGRRSSSPAGFEEFLVFGAEDRSSRGEGAGGLYVVRAGASGDITPAGTATSSAGVLWSNRQAAPSMSSPAILDGYLYILARRGGIVSCYDVQTGEQAYRERLPGTNEFWASPWVYNGKVFCLDASGATHVLEPGPEFKLVRTNQLDDGRFWATSAIADGCLILRGSSKLFCITQ